MAIELLERHAAARSPANWLPLLIACACTAAHVASPLHTRSVPSPSRVQSLGSHRNPIVPCPAGGVSGGGACTQLRLRGGKLEFMSANTANFIEVETKSNLEMIRNSLDPAEYPPLEIQYNERGEMVVPPPMSLEPIAEFKRLVDENGRLLTSKEAEKLGLSRFARKKKGKNSLARRCVCGNKLPCDGDVVITKNEHGKLEYHKVPRHWVGAAHAFETRQPAQYMVTPSTSNLSSLFSHLRYTHARTHTHPHPSTSFVVPASDLASDWTLTSLFSHLSPLMLHEVASMSGMSYEDAAKLADPKVRNATLHPGLYRSNINIEYPIHVTYVICT